MILAGISLRLTRDQAQVGRRQAQLSARLARELAGKTADPWWLELADRLGGLADRFGCEEVDGTDTHAGQPTWSTE